MKKSTILLIILMLISTSLLSGCQEQKTTEKLLTAPVNTFALTLEDLPAKYIIWEEKHNYSEVSTNGSIEGIYPKEFYLLSLVYEEKDINSTFPGVALYMFKFNSSRDANITMHCLSENMANSFVSLNRTTPKNIKQVGDESLYELFEGNPAMHYSNINVTFSYIYFRIGNVVIWLLVQGIMEWDIDYVSLTINYAKIIESRIYSSLG